MTENNGAELPANLDTRRTRVESTTKGSFKRRLAVAIAGAFALIVIAAAMWLGLRASTVSTELKAMSQLIPELKMEVARSDENAATETIKQLKGHTARARDAASDPVWLVAESLPWLGPNFQAAREAATSASDVVRLGAEPLVRVLDTFDWESLSPDGDGVNLAPLVAAEPHLAAAANAVSQSADRLNRIDTTVLLPQVSVPLNQAREQLTSLREGLDTAADAARIAPQMLGFTAPKRFLLLIQNNAEARATGGIPGALAVLQVDGGKMTLGEQTSATELGVMKPTIAVSSEQQQIYSGRLGKFMQDVNLTPDFPSSAQTAQAMWQKKTGQHVDGVLSIDPVALGYILDATGPVKLSNPQLVALASDSLPTELNGKNVVPTLLSDVYAKIEEPQLQDAYFAGVAQEIFANLSKGNGDAKGLVRGMTRGTAEGRILLWSASADEQSVLMHYPLSGSIAGPSISPAQFGVYFNDGTGAKMDYYVKRSAQLVEECTDDGYAQVKVRITSTNTAPKDAATSLSAYVTGGGVFGVPEGTVQTNIVAYGPVQSNVEAAFLEGKKAGFASHRHADRPVGTVTVKLAPGQSTTVEFTFGKIVQHAEPNLSVTPTVQALKDVVLDTIPAKCAPPA